MALTFDDVLNEIGGFGKSQKRNVTLTLLLILPTSYITYLPIFILTVPKHRCALEGIDNDTYQVQSPSHLALINKMIPLDNATATMSTCYMRVSAPTNRSRGNVSQPDTETTVVKCKRLVYDKEFFDLTLIEKFNLVCDQKNIRTHANMAMMSGKMLCAIMQGVVSDIFGRKKCLSIFIVVLIAGTIANIFIFNVTSLLAFRFAAGYISTSIYMASYVLGIENIGTSYRRLYSVALGLTWIAGGFILTGVAYFIRDYFYLSIAVTALTLPYLLHTRFLTESPRWLLTKGRADEAKVILEKMASTNGKPFPHDMFAEILVSEFHIGKEDPDLTLERQLATSEKRAVYSHENLCTFLGHPRLAFRYAIVVFNWIVNSMVYYAILFNVSNLAGSVYLNFFLVNCVDFVANVLSYFVVERFGRKLSYCGMLLLASVSCLSGVLPPLFAHSESSHTLINVLSLIGRAGVSTSLNTIYLFSAELFPTSVRNTAMGSFSTSSRVGSMIAPYIADLGLFVGGQIADILPLLLCGGAGIAALCLSLLLPETVGKSLPNTIAEALVIDREAHRKSSPAPDDHHS